MYTFASVSVCVCCGLNKAKSIGGKYERQAAAKKKIWVKQTIETNKKNTKIDWVLNWGAFLSAAGCICCVLMALEFSNANRISVVLFVFARLTFYELYKYFCYCNRFSGISFSVFFCLGWSTIGNVWRFVLRLSFYFFLLLFRACSDPLRECYSSGFLTAMRTETSQINIK